MKNKPLDNYDPYKNLGPKTTSSGEPHGGKVWAQQIGTIIPDGANRGTDAIGTNSIDDRVRLRVGWSPA